MSLIDIAYAELFAHGGGKGWFVSHYLFAEEN
jgi:hypothetical protein